MMKATREQVYAVVDGERDYQDAMRSAAHGDPSETEVKTLEQMAYYVEDYLRQIKTQLTRHWGPDAYVEPLHGFRKIAALAVAAMEMHGAPARIAPTKHDTGVSL